MCQRECCRRVCPVADPPRKQKGRCLALQLVNGDLVVDRYAFGDLEMRMVERNGGRGRGMVRGGGGGEEWWEGAEGERNGGSYDMHFGNLVGEKRIREKGSRGEGG